MELLNEFLGSEFVYAALFAALFTFLLMLLLFKGAVYLAFEYWWKKRHEGEMPLDWPLRSLAVNLISYLLSIGIVFGRFQFDWLTSLLAGVLAMAFAIGGYEQLNNLLGAIGLDLDVLNVFHYFG